MTATQQFEARIRELIDSKQAKSKEDAIRKIAQHEPELHRRYLTECNPGKSM